MHVVLAGGGTAGHIEPALALAEALRRRDPGIGVTMLGTSRGLETRLVPARGFELALIPAVPLPRRLTPALLAVPGRLREAVTSVEKILADVGASVVVGFGGYVALPAYLAARRMRLPYVVHEANARPGLANRWGARFTRFVAVADPSIRLPHAVTVGIPLRTAITTLDRAKLRAEAREHFGLLPDAPTLAVTGGSQGARSINQAVIDALPELATAGVQVVHVAGPKQFAEVQPAADAARAGLPSDAPPYVLLAYADRMELVYAAADLLLCRAGALTCAELAAVGLPAVYVPLPHGNGEQRLNARPVVRAGGGVLISDAELRRGAIRSVVLPLVTDRERLAQMAQRAAAHGRRDADERLADLVLQAAESRRIGGTR
ncbi:MAG: undecaprenyldiphospho-muramoylpentapeptide beta-N-acetylglucosaminyltransferase [Acidothermus sp.]|nr:undecaprenyldiphospho-muramoylpentapeptide beta-N-acetylglucosaminyltransferase [Acidothermus sp.]MCL6537789.1 undecaprenyldiphospho-muramoylpentapeptide beta-N-acetylglucosaminyltransferase [Acidothermus sp.]